MIRKILKNEVFWQFLGLFFITFLVYSIKYNLNAPKEYREGFNIENSKEFVLKDIGTKMIVSSEAGIEYKVNLGREYGEYKYNINEIYNFKKDKGYTVYFKVGNEEYYALNKFKNSDINLEKIRYVNLNANQYLTAPFVLFYALEKKDFDFKKENFKSGVSLADKTDIKDKYGVYFEYTLYASLSIFILFLLTRNKLVKSLSRRFLKYKKEIKRLKLNNKYLTKEIEMKNNRLSEISYGGSLIQKKDIVETEGKYNLIPFFENNANVKRINGLLEELNNHEDHIYSKKLSRMLEDYLFRALEIYNKKSSYLSGEILVGLDNIEVILKKEIEMSDNKNEDELKNLNQYLKEYVA